MIILFVLGLVLGIAAVAFVAQNVAMVTVAFLSWQFTGSLALVLSLALSVGALVALLIILPEGIKNHFKYKKLLAENKQLEEELRKQKELTYFAKKELPTEERIAAIEEGDRPRMA